MSFEKDRDMIPFIYCLFCDGLLYLSFIGKVYKSYFKQNCFLKLYFSYSLSELWYLIKINYRFLYKITLVYILQKLFVIKQTCFDRNFYYLDKNYIITTFGFNYLLYLAITYVLFINLLGAEKNASFRTKTDWNFSKWFEKFRINCQKNR